MPLQLVTDISDRSQADGATVLARWLCLSFVLRQEILQADLQRKVAALDSSEGGHLLKQVIHDFVQRGSMSGG